MTANRESTKRKLSLLQLAEKIGNAPLLMITQERTHLTLQFVPR